MTPTWLFQECLVYANKDMSGHKGRLIPGACHIHKSQQELLEVEDMVWAMRRYEEVQRQLTCQVHWLQ